MLSSVTSRAISLLSCGWRLYTVVGVAVYYRCGVLLFSVIVVVAVDSAVVVVTTDVFEVVVSAKAKPPTMNQRDFLRAAAVR